MKLYYDLHIHSALSPCADDDMTPNNIVNMSLIKGLDVIAVADHNTCGNVRAVTEAADGKVLVIPAMEIETAEEVHVLSLFPTIEAAEEMWNTVKKNRLDIKNKPEIFGHQLYMDKEDNVIGEEEYLLVSAIKLSIEEVFEAVRTLGGTAIPAHIDRSSCSVISNLGFISPELGVKTVEITEKNLSTWAEKYKDCNIITNSDAHYLGDISEAVRHIEICNKNIAEILDSFTK